MIQVKTLAVQTFGRFCPKSLFLEEKHGQIGCFAQQMRWHKHYLQIKLWRIDCEQLSLPRFSTAKLSAIAMAHGM